MPRPAAQGKTSTVADARSANLVDRVAPAAILPYLRLARADRPTGFWLLALPCLWSVALASRSIGADYPDPWLLALFAIGAIALRAAGCTYNDILERTSTRKSPYANRCRADNLGESSDHLHAGALPYWLAVPLVQHRDDLPGLQWSPLSPPSAGEALLLLAAGGTRPCFNGAPRHRVLGRLEWAAAVFTPAPSPGLSATTPSTPIRTARTMLCSG
jgi:hypothetical protein